jgi:ribonuclease HI
VNRHQADASVRQDRKSAWACFVEGVHRNPCGRLPDHTPTPITVAELHTIYAALAWLEAQDMHEDTIIHSDSITPIKILAQTKTRIYPKITTKIINSALSQRGSLTTLHWVPSHTNIEGNERADTLTSEATNLTNILHVEQTQGAYKHMMTKFLHKQITPNPDIIHKVTAMPHIIIPLFKKDPYIWQKPNNTQ